MARKSQQPAAPFAHLLDLFTAAERKLLDSSIGTSLAKATHAQLDSAAAKARSLRDKWRDLSASQGRSSKRAATGTAGANARSHEKAAVFHDAVERIEKRIAEVVAGLGGMVRKTTTARAKARDKTIAGRASRRTTPKPEIPARPIAAIPAPPVQTKVAVPKAPAVATVKPAAKVVAAKKPTRTVSKKARVDRSAIAGPASVQSLGLDRGKQRAAATAAKAGRIKLKGADTRRAGHTMARGKRTQARRDMRSR